MKYLPPIATRLALALVVSLSFCVSWAQAAEDGRRAVEVRRYGISVRVPQAWRLINWARDEQAFALKLPQDGGKSGHVSCSLVSGPLTLEDYQKQLAAEVERPAAVQPATEQPSVRPTETSQRKLVENRIDTIDAGRYGADLARALNRWLVSAWETELPDGGHTYEVSVRAVYDGTLYTFALDSDEAHYQAYRLDFEDMLASARFSPLETGLRRMPNGYWMQGNFRFAVKLPEGWQPGLGPSDRVLFYATGARHEAFADQLLILASPPRQLDLQMLKQVLPEQVQRTDHDAQVTCSIVRQGGATALETVIHTVQGGVPVVVLERRFGSPLRNYEVKFTVRAEEFERLADELRKSLDSFVEVANAAPQTEA
ncbi:MAG: hypothetical protein JSS27_05775 [Planctomycetes bacterium]|nr:hypothetical protein [Planctomycetota bacterium]